MSPDKVLTMSPAVQLFLEEAKKHSPGMWLASEHRVRHVKAEHLLLVRHLVLDGVDHALRELELAYAGARFQRMPLGTKANSFDGGGGAIKRYVKRVTR